jgi:uncharacterized protein YjiS (DUF1127 family)
MAANNGETVSRHLHPQPEEAGNVESSLDASVGLWASRSGRLASMMRGCWASIGACLVEWRRHGRSRRELIALNDHDLWDIGMLRSTAEFEASRPVWRR